MLNRTCEGECRVWVLGLGSAFGDDHVSWELVSQLQATLPVGVRSTTTTDPLSVLEVPAECEFLLVVDACRGAGLPGSVHRFDWPDVQLSVVGSLSSHGVGLAAALELAAMLGRLPPKVVILAVEGLPGKSESRHSSAVEAAIPELISRIHSEIAQPKLQKEIDDDREHHPRIFEDARVPRSRDG